MTIKKIEVGTPAAQVQASVAAIVDYQLGAGTSQSITNWSNLTELFNRAAAEAQVAGIANNDPGFTARGRINDLIDACGIPEGAGWSIDYTSKKYHHAADTFSRSGPRWLTVGPNEVAEIADGVLAYIPDRGVSVNGGHIRVSLHPLDFSKWASIGALTTTLAAVGSFPTPVRVESTGSAEDRIEVGVDGSLFPSFPATLRLRLRARYRSGTSNQVRFEIRTGPSTVATLSGPGGTLTAEDSSDIAFGSVEDTTLSNGEFEVEAVFSILNQVSTSGFKLSFGPGSADSGRYADLIVFTMDTGPEGAEWVFGDGAAYAIASPDILTIRTGEPLSPKRWLVHLQTSDGVTRAAARDEVTASHDILALFDGQRSFIQKVWGIEKQFATIRVGESLTGRPYRGISDSVGSIRYPNGALADGVASQFWLQEYSEADGDSPRGIKVTVNRPASISAGDWPEYLGQFGNLVLANTVTSLPILEGFEWVVTGNQAVAWFQTPSGSSGFILPEAGADLHVYLD